MNFKRLLKPILVILAILILTLSVSAGDLFSTYDKRIKVTIDHTKIDADLSWFPVTVFLGNYGDIYVGAAATNRGITESAGFTIIAKNNPANSSGTITSVEIYAETNMNGVIVATFSADGNNITARDSYSIGSVTAGSKQTFEVELSVETGDYLGFYNSSGGISSDDTGGDGRWYKEGNYTDCVDEAFTSGAGTIYSIYATGFEKSQGAEVFTEFDADEDFDRIAFTSSDGETQLYADCELFDVSEQKAIYHVSKTGWTVSSSTDTDIYLYYDNDAGHNTTYISKSGGTAAQSVWDSNFKAVYHMADADEPSDNIELQLKEHLYKDTVVSPEIDFSITSSVLKINSTTGGLGRGYAFANFTNTYLDGKKVKITYETSSSTENMAFDCYVLDGSYDRTSGTDFPHKSDLLSKGNGTLSTVFKVTGTNAETTVTTDVLDLSGGSETDVCLMLYIQDSWSGRSGYLKIFKLEILDSSNNVLKQVYFDKSAVDMESTGGTDDYGLLKYQPVIDSTSNANHGTKKAANEPAEATGLVGQGQDFDGSNDYIALGGAIVSTHPFTIEAIARINDTNPRAIISVGDKDVSNKYYYIGVSSNKFALSVSNTSAIINLSANTYNDSNFHYVVGTFVDNTEKNLYVDIADKKTITNSVAVPPIDATEAGRICDSSPSNYYNDVVDEIRISNSERSDAWIGATYSTLWDTLLTYGSEETAPTGEATNVLFIFSNF